MGRWKLNLDFEKQLRHCRVPNKKQDAPSPRGIVIGFIAQIRMTPFRPTRQTLEVSATMT